MSEFVDLVDSTGKVVESRIPRADVEQFPDLHMQIAVAVIRNSLGEILVHERAASKVDNPGDIDHVCGAIVSGETPKDAVTRESLEEVGIKPSNFTLINEGINSYGRYEFLFSGISDLPVPDNLNPREVAWAGYRTMDWLVSGNNSGELTFVDGFFDEIKMVMEATYEE